MANRIQTPPPKTELRFDAGVTLVGGGALDAAAFAAAVAVAPVVVAADGGADALAALGARPEAIIGDLDSLKDAAAWRARGIGVHGIAEQESTDLEKCLYATEAPFYIGVGFTGRRFDHTLAALHAVMRQRAKRVLILGEEEVVFLAPPALRLSLAPGARVSFFPLAPMRGLASAGLRWPIDGLDFAIGARIGTSNEAASADVEAAFDRPGMAVLLERRWLGAALAALGCAASG